MPKYTLERTEGTIRNEQSRDANRRLTKKTKPTSLKNKHINTTDPTKKPEVNSCAREGLEVSDSPQ